MTIIYFVETKSGYFATVTMGEWIKEMMWFALLLLSFYYSNFRHVKLFRHNNEEIRTVEGCSTITYNLNSSDETQGPYQCVGTLNNGTVVRESAGNLHVVGET